MVLVLLLLQASVQWDIAGMFTLNENRHAGRITEELSFVLGQQEITEEVGSWQTPSQQKTIESLGGKSQNLVGVVASSIMCHPLLVIISRSL